MFSQFSGLPPEATTKIAHDERSDFKTSRSAGKLGMQAAANQLEATVS